MPPPVDEAIGLALPSASLAQLPVEGVRSIWRRTHYDYSKDFADTQEHLETLETQVQLLRQGRVFDGAAAGTPEYKAISWTKEVTVAINGATKLPKEYILLPSEDKKKWRELNETLLRSLMDSAGSGIECIFMSYSIYSKVKASKTHSRLERWLNQKESKDEEHRGTGEVVRGEGYTSEGEEEGQQMAGIHSPNPR